MRLSTVRLIRLMNVFFFMCMVFMAVFSTDTVYTGVIVRQNCSRNDDHDCTAVVDISGFGECTVYANQRNGIRGSPDFPRLHSSEYIVGTFVRVTKYDDVCKRVGIPNKGLVIVATATVVSIVIEFVLAQRTGQLNVGSSN
jgi:preprotein translocase subunit SecG